MTRSTWSSRPLPAALRPALAALLLSLAACNEDGTPTTVQGQTAAAAPVIAQVSAQDAGNGIVTLRVDASDPDSSRLTYAWRVSDGQLSATSSAAVQWRVPKTAGQYTATVDVTNAKGQRASGSQGFTVSQTGAVAANGTLSVQSQGTGTTTSPGRANGGFVIPSPLASQQANPPIVGGVAPAASPAPPSAPLTQPVATPAPLTPVPTAAPLQPVATPTPTPPPLVLPPSPLPTDAPPTAKPGVPVPPPTVWREYDPTKVPTKAGLLALHFPTSEKRGFVAASDGSVLMYDKTGDTEPALLMRRPIGNTNPLGQIFFTSDTTGYVAGNGGVVFRTKDAGLNWESIGPTGQTVSMVSSLVVYNDQIAVIADEAGRVFRTESLNAAAASVSWTSMPTQPFDRPADWPRGINAGAGFRDATVSFFVGDGIFKLDSDATGAGIWRRVLDLTGTTSYGFGKSVEMVSENEIWVGTASGNLLRSTDGGATWTNLPSERYLNREYNGNASFLPQPGAIGAMSVLNSNTAFLAGAIRVFDTQDAGASWRQVANLGFNDLQIRNVVKDGKGDFVGFAAGNGGAFYTYMPSGLR